MFVEFCFNNLKHSEEIQCLKVFQPLKILPPHDRAFALSSQERTVFSPIDHGFTLLQSLGAWPEKNEYRRGWFRRC
jgi:hypothetical protein